MFAKGRTFEYKVRDFLKKRGWAVYRSYASKGTIDLLAEKNGIKIGIQVKNRKTGEYLTPKELGELQTFHDIFVVNSDDTYTMNIWENNKIVSATWKAPIMTIHAYSLPNVKQIQWKRLVGNNIWNDAEKLIKTGKPY